MVLLYYEIVFLLSLGLTILYSFFWNKRFGVHFTLIFIITTFTDLGYIFLAEAESLDSALTAQKLIYLGACFPILLIMLCIFSVCRIRLNKWLRALLITIDLFVYMGALTMGKNELFYKNVTYTTKNGITVLEKDYGVLHHLFYAMVILYVMMCFAALVYSLRKKDISNKTIYLMFLPVLLTFAAFFGGRLYEGTVELVPISYLIAQIIYLIIIHRICLYDIDDTVADSLVQNGTTGFISFDFKRNYLASNETAKRIFPILNDMKVDEPVDADPELSSAVEAWIKRFETGADNEKMLYETNGRTYIVEVAYLCIVNRKYGYQFYLTDDTRNQEYISLLDRYNADLRTEVAKKTEDILEMHNKLILSMAVMVESRDNSTGGHIRRTSEVVRILIKEMMKENELGLTESFCRNIIKAAPMHDLGKIAVDDAILRKPGRFTDEEYEKMKAHAAEGARIVHNVLEGTDDMEFHIIAENVAHYHHERWDGSGYPEKLTGENIPLEARIMAIADVYDALVSKRVYKEKMSFEDADRIIMEGMGKHFDKRLEKYYVSARPALEAYYSSLS